MKKYFLFMVMALPLCALAQEKPKEENKKLELKPYGFVKGDMVYATGGVYSWGNGAICNLSAPQFASGKDTAALGFTSQHTRFGLKGTVGEKTKAGGLIELDFYGGAFDGNVRPRIRLAYASVIHGGFEARMGQMWDIFSPNNANTNNTNGNMWYAGNRGFRRAQLYLGYKCKMGEKLFPMIQATFGEAAKEDYIKGPHLGTDNQAVSPMIQTRLSAKYEAKEKVFYELGFSYVMAGYTERKGVREATGTVIDTLKSNLDLKTSGICVDFSLPFHKYFSLLGEFNSGTNLNNANLFNVAGNYSWKIDDSTKTVSTTDKLSTGFWFNATSKISDHFNVVIGYGMDKNNTEKMSVGAVEGNTTIYADLVFPIKHGFSVALEFQNIKTTVATNVDANSKVTDREDYSANIINLSAKVVF